MKTTVNKYRVFNVEFLIAFGFTKSRLKETNTPNGRLSFILHNYYFLCFIYSVIYIKEHKFKEGGFVSTNTDEPETVTFPDKTSRFKERLEQALTEQDEATKKRIQEALKGSKPPIPPCLNKCKCRN